MIRKTVSIAHARRNPEFAFELDKGSGFVRFAVDVVLVDGFLDALLVGKVIVVLQTLRDDDGSKDTLLLGRLFVVLNFLAVLALVLKHLLQPLALDPFEHVIAGLALVYYPSATGNHHTTPATPTAPAAMGRHHAPPAPAPFTPATSPTKPEKYTLRRGQMRRGEANTGRQLDWGWPRPCIQALGNCGEHRQMCETHQHRHKPESPDRAQSCV